MALGGNVTLAGVAQALDVSLNTIRSEFKLLRQQDGIIRKLATRYDLKPGEGAQKHILNYGRLTAYSLTDGVEVGQAQTIADVVTSFTPSEVGLQVVLANTTIDRVADRTLFRKIGMMVENAYDMKEDEDLCDLFDDFVPIVGAAGTVLSPGLIHSAVARLRIGDTRRTATTKHESPPTPYYGVFHPLSLAVVAGRLMPLTDVPTGTNVYTGIAAGATLGAGTSGLTPDLIRKGQIKELAGIPIVSDPNILIDASDDGSGLVFSKEGLCYIHEKEPSMKDEEVEARFHRLTYAGRYGSGVYRASNYGIEVRSDATMPTA